MSHRFPSLAALALCATGLACQEELPPPAAEAGICEPARVWAELPDAVSETSGLAASRKHRGIFWTHNDSGGDSAVFAIDSVGTVIARVRVRGSTNRDWEDIAVASCDPGSDDHCLFIADIGDNRERHSRIAIYRIPEPDPHSDTVSRAADRLRVTYPEGPRDAEAVFVTDAGIHILTKGRSHSIEVFRLRPPYRPGRSSPLERIQQLAPPPTSVSAQVTAAAAGEDHNTVVVRSYSGLRFYEVADDTLRPLGDHADLLSVSQLQGEGVDFISPTRLVLSGEAGGREPATLATTLCDPRGALPGPHDPARP